MTARNREKIQTPYWVTLGAIAIFSTIAIIAYLILNYIKIPNPYNWNALNWNHVGIVPIATLITSVIILFFLINDNKYDKKIPISTVTLMIIYVLLFLNIYKLENGNLNFNGLFVLCFMLTSWLFVLLPFLWKNHNLSLEKEWKNYIFLTTGLMWLAPLITELIIEFGWYINGIYAENISGSVLGGMGFNDFLFLPGFVTLLYSRLLAILEPKIARWVLTSKKKTST